MLVHQTYPPSVGRPHSDSSSAPRMRSDSDDMQEPQVPFAVHNLDTPNHLIPFSGAGNENWNANMAEEHSSRDQHPEAAAAAAASSSSYAAPSSAPLLAASSSAAAAAAAAASNALPLHQPGSSIAENPVAQFVALHAEDQLLAQTLHDLEVQLEGARQATLKFQRQKDEVVAKIAAEKTRHVEAKKEQLKEADRVATAARLAMTDAQTRQAIAHRERENTERQIAQLQQQMEGLTATLTAANEQVQHAGLQVGQAVAQCETLQLELQQAQTALDRLVPGQASVALSLPSSSSAVVAAAAAAAAAAAPAAGAVAAPAPARAVAAPVAAVAVAVAVAGPSPVRAVASPTAASPTASLAVAGPAIAASVVSHHRPVPRSGSAAQACSVMATVANDSVMTSALLGRTTRHTPAATLPAAPLPAAAAAAAPRSAPKGSKRSNAVLADKTNTAHLPMGSQPSDKVALAHRHKRTRGLVPPVVLNLPAMPSAHAPGILPPLPTQQDFCFSCFVHDAEVSQKKQPKTCALRIGPVIRSLSHGADLRQSSVEDLILMAMQQVAGLHWSVADLAMAVAGVRQLTEDDRQGQDELTQTIATLLQGLMDQSSTRLHYALVRDRVKLWRVTFGEVQLYKISFLPTSWASGSCSHPAAPPRGRNVAASSAAAAAAASSSSAAAAAAAASSS